MKDRNNFLLILGSTTTLLSGLLTAFVPSLAYVTFTLSSEIPKPFAQYAPWEVSFHPATAGLLLASIGASIVLLSLIAHDRKVLFLSSVGISLGSVGLFLSAWPRPEVSMIWVHNIYLPWLGTIAAMIGVSIMFVGFVYKNRISRKLLLSVPIMAPLYIMAPVMILSKSRVLMGGYNAEYLGVFSLFGHLVVLGGAYMVIRKALQKPQNIT